MTTTSDEEKNRKTTNFSGYIAVVEACAPLPLPGGSLMSLAVV
jgi:hypothetical protein